MANNRCLMAGDRVVIYFDPLMRSRSEGVAELVAPMSNPDPSGYNIWLIRFLGEQTKTLRYSHPDDRIATRREVAIGELREVCTPAQREGVRRGL